MPEKKLNPDIKPVYVGTEELREVKVYPLSLKDHTEKMPKILVGAYDSLLSELGKIEDFKKINNEQGQKILNTFKDILYQKIEEILELVTKEEGRPKPEEMTSNQLFEIVDVIFSVNYEGTIKNSINLFKRVRNLGA